MTDLIKIMHCGCQYDINGTGGEVAPSDDIFGDGSDGDCVIEYDSSINGNSFMEAKEYNFCNFTICEGVKLRFCGEGIPIIRVKNNFLNCGTVCLRNPFLCSNVQYSEPNLKKVLCGDKNDCINCVTYLASELTIENLQSYNAPAGSLMNVAGCSSGGQGGNAGGAGGKGQNSPCGYTGGIGGTSSYSNSGGGGGGGACNSGNGGNGGDGMDGIGGGGGNGGYGSSGGGGGFGYLQGGTGGFGGYGGGGGRGGNSIVGNGGDGGSSQYIGGDGGNSYYGQGGNGGGISTSGSNCRPGYGGCSVYGNGGSGGPSSCACYNIGKGGHSIYGNGGVGCSAYGNGISGAIARGGIYDLGLFANGIENKGYIIGDGNKGHSTSTGSRGAKIYLAYKSFSSVGDITVNGNGCPSGSIKHYNLVNN